MLKLKSEKLQVLWCVLKHLSVAYIQSVEMAERTNYPDLAGRIMTLILDALAIEGINIDNITPCE